MSSLHDAVEAAHTLPPSLTIPVPLFLCLVGYFAAVSPHVPGVRKKAYLLSSLSSAFMTLASLPFVYAYATGGLEAVWYGGQEGWMKVLCDVAVAAFGTYLFTDLLVGYIAYRTEVGLLTGWIHHTVYIALMVYLARSNMSPVFMLAAVMELPTFDLAISNLFPSVRSDERFLSLMLATRILFNAWYVFDCYRSVALTDNSWVPTGAVAAALALHITWMKGGVTGYLRRRAKAKKAAHEEAVAAGIVAEKRSKTPHLAPTTPALDATIPDFSPVSPDDSPLVTPRTPSQATTIIRDKNLFPNITIPTMPNLPIPAIPTLSDMAAALPQAKANLNQMQFEFTEAVNRRWEEQRERLAAKGEALLRLRRGGREVAVDE